MSDCSWCAAEQGLKTTDSPSICERHMALLLQQSADRQREREDQLGADNAGDEHGRSVSLVQ